MRVSDSGFGLVRVMATGVLARAKHPASCGRAVCFLRSTTYNQTLPAAWRRLLPGSGAAAPLQLGRRSCCGWGKRGLAGANFPAEERQKPRLVSEPEMFLSAPSSSSTAPLISLQGDLGGARAGPRSQRITGEEEEGRGRFTQLHTGSPGGAADPKIETLTFWNPRTGANLTKNAT